MSLKITSGKVNRAQKVVIYGPEGIGKSTIASKFPNPLFIDTEDGTSHMDVNRLEKPTSWEGLIALVKEVAQNPGICKTLAIDTADKDEQMCIKDLCAKYKKNGIEEFGYGKGYTYVAEEFSRFLTALDEVIFAGINVVVIAHAKMRKFEQPDEMGAYDRWEMKMSKQVAPLIKEWADMLLFINYKTYVVSPDSGNNKVQGGKRVMYATHHPCWDAKNRHNLPDEMEFDFESIKHIFADAAPAPKAATSVFQKLSEMMKAADVIDTDLQNLVAAKGHYPTDTKITDYSEDFVNRWVVPNWDKIVKTIKTTNGGNN